MTAELDHVCVRCVDADSDHVFPHRCGRIPVYYVEGVASTGGFLLFPEVGDMKVLPERGELVGDLLEGLGAFEEAQDELTGT